VGTKYKGTQREKLVLDSFIALNRTVNQLQSEVQAFLQPYELSVSQFGVLEMLYHLGPLSASECAEKLLRSAGNLTMVLNNLQKKQFIKKIRTESDRRRLHISLTPKGEEIVQKIMPHHVAQLCDVMRGISDVELEELKRLCKKQSKLFL